MSARDSTTRKLLDLPYEILMKILSYVPHDDFRNLRLVNRRCNDLLYDAALWRKVELNFPRTVDQMHQLASDVFPSVGANLQELTITGFYSTSHFFERDRVAERRNEMKPRTLNMAILKIIRANCPGLKTLIIRNCKLSIFPVEDHPYLFPDSLEKLEFHSCRLPGMPSNWMGQMSVGAPKHFLQNLTTLKFERCFNVDMEFLCYLRACPAIKNFSLKGSLLAFINPSAVVHPPYPINIWENLRVLDISGILRFAVLIHDRVLNDARCAITHLFMEKCTLIPRRAHDHLKIKYLSVAGYRPAAGDGNAFDEIDAWASLPTMEQINASGCVFTETQRKELVKRHQNVIFNLGVEFEKSVRAEF